MTHNQKMIIARLLEGCTIAASGPGQIRLRDAAGNPVMKITGKTWYWLKRNIVRRKKNLFLIDRRKVRAFHGNSFVKKLYKGTMTIWMEQNTPPPLKRKSHQLPVRHSFNL